MACDDIGGAGLLVLVIVMPSSATAATCLDYDTQAEAQAAILAANRKDAATWRAKLLNWHSHRRRL